MCGGSGSGKGKGGGGGQSEAQLQARVDNMNQLVGQLNAKIKSNESKFNALKESRRNSPGTQAELALNKNTRELGKTIDRDRKRMLNIYGRMNKIIDENS